LKNHSNVSQDNIQLGDARQLELIPSK